jgi:hypothetical protein
LKQVQCPTPDGLCTAAAAADDLELLSSLHQQGNVLNVRDVLDVAAGQGNIPMLNWVVDRGAQPNQATMAIAAAYGHTAACARLRELGCAWDSWALKQAAAHGHVETVKWLRKHSCPSDDN